MIDHDDSLTWRKSTYSGSTDCVEVAELGPDVVLMRNSRSPRAGVLTFNRREIDAFLRGAKAGEFDHLT